MTEHFKGYTPVEVMKAHQYLYYVGPSSGVFAIWTDHEYDRWCKDHGLDGSGGSDRAKDYSVKEKALARKMVGNPTAYPWT